MKKMILISIFSLILSTSAFANECRAPAVKAAKAATKTDRFTKGQSCSYLGAEEGKNNTFIVNFNCGSGDAMFIVDCSTLDASFDGEFTDPEARL